MTREEMLKAGTTDLRSKVRYPEKIGGDYVVSLESAHQMHCVVSYTAPKIWYFLAHTCVELASQSLLAGVLQFHRSCVPKHPKNSPSASW
jgi:hypothetical protein